MEKTARLPNQNHEWDNSPQYFNWQKMELTEKPYLPYPNYKKASGALGEYNASLW